jgi:hypothetical protein
MTLIVSGLDAVGNGVATASSRRSASGSGLDEAAANRVTRELHPVVHPELLENVRGRSRASVISHSESFAISTAIGFLSTPCTVAC